LKWSFSMVGCLIVLVLCTYGTFAQEYFQPQILPAYYTKRAPSIDGELKEWQHITPVYLSSTSPSWLQGFRVWEPKVTNEAIIPNQFSSAQLWFMWDQKNLYVAARIWEEEISKHSRLNIYLDPWGRRSNKVMPGQVCCRIAYATSLRDGAVIEDLSTRKTTRLLEVVTVPWNEGWIIEATIPLNVVLGSPLLPEREMTCDITLEKMNEVGSRKSALSYFGGMEHWLKSYAWGSMLLSE